MASRRLRVTSAAGSVPQLRATRTLLSTAIESSSLGHDLIHRLRAERYQVFLSGHFALWASAAVVLPLLEYVFWYRAPYVLLFAAIGAPQCVALAIGLRLARLGRYSQSISLVCITNWISAILKRAQFRLFIGETGTSGRRTWLSASHPMKWTTR